MSLFARSSDTTAQLLPAQKDRYRIMGAMRRGDEADFLNGFDTRLNRFVLLKRLRKENCSEEWQVRSFVNETRLLSFLDHPGIASIYDSFRDENGELCYAMKFLAAGDLRAEMQSKSRAQRLGIFAKLCETLAFVHSRGVAHLDLHPENVLIGQFGEVLIMDWGRARMFDEKPYRDCFALVRDAPPPPDDAAGNRPVRVHEGTSPEQLTADRQELNSSSDIFSLGCILYEMMADVPPFSAADPQSLTRQICEQQVIALHEVNAEVPFRLSQICSCMLEKDPYARYHTVYQVLQDLDALQNSGQSFATRTFGRGDIIFREGERGEYAFTVLAGNVEVIKKAPDGYKILAVLGKDETVGELAVFTHEPRTATIRAAAPDTVIRIMERPRVEQELKKLSPWVERMIAAMSRRFITLNDKIISLSAHPKK